jgi:S-DNA-T family DNA segregation ATPase FtsK/SpoIIIE
LDPAAEATPLIRTPIVVDTRISSPGLRAAEPPVTKAKSFAAPDTVLSEPVDPPAEIWDAYDEEENLPVFSRKALAADRRPIVTLVQASSKRVAPSRQAMDEAQPRLNFDTAPDTDAGYELPPLSLLTPASSIQRNQVSTDALQENARMLESVLEDYGVRGEIVSVRPGPVVTMYELEPAPGLKASRVIGLSDDIARSMSALSARVSTVPGRTVIGIELPNAVREKVVLREILSAREFGDSGLRLPLALGKDIGGEPIVANLAKMPHLLIAGTTGSGKSVAINTMILSLLYKLTPQECRLIMIDPKMLELSVYDGIPHLLSPVVTDPKKAVVALKWVVGEMEDRYRKMSKMGVRNIEGYNGRVREALAKNEMFKRTIQTGFDENTGEPVFETDEFDPVTLPYIVVVVDEMADLMMVAGKEIEACIQRLAQMARASGIHLIMATQRPSVDVITGTIKANFPTRISFQVTSRIDSRTILGEQGAEQLLGMGDMLYMAGGAKITRIHGPFVSDEEVEEIVAHLKSFGPPEYMSGVVEGPEDENAAEIDSLLGLGSDGVDDSLYDQAVAIVARDRKVSTSYIQRKLGIGYNKAAKLVEQMEEHSVISAANHVGKREILIEER